jgi:hypothetical protein
VRHRGRPIALLAVGEESADGLYDTGRCAVLDGICALLSIVLAPASAPEDALAMLVHDIKSPMQGVVGFARLLRTGTSGDLTGEQENLLERIAENGEYVVDLADRILSAGGLDETAIRKGAVEPRALVEGVVQRLQGKLAARRVGLETWFERNLPDLHADAFYLGQALQNLADNAINAAPAGSGVRIAVHAVSGALDIVIEGDGRQSNAQAVDLPEVPVQARARRLYHGMGLSIASRIVTAHGGRLEVRRARGTMTVHVTIPLLREE